MMMEMRSRKVIDAIAPTLNRFNHTEQERKRHGDSVRLGDGYLVLSAVPASSGSSHCMVLVLVSDLGPPDVNTPMCCEG